MNLRDFSKLNIVLALSLLGGPTGAFGLPSSAMESVQTDPESGSQVIRGIESPRYLYHWTTYPQLLKIASDKRFTDPWGRFADTSLNAEAARRNMPTLFFSRWPQFRSTTPGALFAWTHPILGMKGGELENYGPFLVRIEIDQTKAAAARTILKIPNNTHWAFMNGNLETNGIDLVDNIFEWVILNPNVIKTFTADIDVLRPTLQRELELLKNPTHRYEKKDRHWVDFKAPGREEFLNYAIQIVEELLKFPPDMIPTWFRRTETGEQVDAPYRTGNDIVRQLAIDAAERKQNEELIWRQKRMQESKEWVAQHGAEPPFGKNFKPAVLHRLRVASETNPALAHLEELAEALPEGLYPDRKFEFLDGLLRQEPFDPYRAIMEAVRLSFYRLPLYDFQRMKLRNIVRAHTSDPKLIVAFKTRLWPRDLAIREIEPASPIAQVKMKIVELEEVYPSLKGDMKVLEEELRARIQLFEIENPEKADSMYRFVIHYLIDHRIKFRTVATLAKPLMKTLRKSPFDPYVATLQYVELISRLEGNDSFARRFADLSKGSKSEIEFQRVLATRQASKDFRVLFTTLKSEFPSPKGECTELFFN